MLYLLVYRLMRMIIPSRIRFIYYTPLFSLTSWRHYSWIRGRCSTLECSVVFTSYVDDIALYIHFQYYLFELVKCTDGFMLAE